MPREHEWYRDEETGQYIFDQSIIVAAPLETCYGYWSHFENFPQIMRHITKVERTLDNRSHWEANVGGQHAEWEAESAMAENEMVTWHSLSGLRNSGTVRFTPESNGCRVSVHLMYDPPYSIIGDLVAQRNTNDKLFKELGEDLRNFKEAVESGEAEQRYRRAA